MIKKFRRSLNTKSLLICILLFSLVIRLWQIDYPKTYVFDEVYHAFTAKEYLKGNIAAWEWWTSPPPGVAYEWTHPPVAKEIMAGSMFIFRSESPWAWRLPGVILGVVNIYLLYLITKNLFKNESLAVLTAFLYSLDGLSFVQSRTGMNDVYLISFGLTSLLFLLKKKFWISAIFLGLALSSKWTGFYLFVFEITLVLKMTGLKGFKNLIWFIILPPIIYLIAYLPFFWTGHNFNQFINIEALVNCQLLKTENPCQSSFGLQNQMLHYHSHLVATHDYSSPWWSWPLNLYPVWYFVEYHPNGYISNIFASGNPIMFWLGITTMILCLIEYLRKRSFGLLVVTLGFLIFWLPWALSPRIMFLYHFTPSVPFLCMGLSYQLSEFWKEKANRPFVILMILLIILGFIAIYPFLTGIALPKNIIEMFFNTNASKNPFGN